MIFGTFNKNYTIGGIRIMFPTDFINTLEELSQTKEPNPLTILQEYVADLENIQGQALLTSCLQGTQIDRQSFIALTIKWIPYKFPYDERRNDFLWQVYLQGHATILSDIITIPLFFISYSSTGSFNAVINPIGITRSLLLKDIPEEYITKSMFSDDDHIVTYHDTDLRSVLDIIFSGKRFCDLCNDLLDHSGYFDTHSTTLRKE